MTKMQNYSAICKNNIVEILLEMQHFSLVFEKMLEETLNLVTLLYTLTIRAKLNLRQKK